jgi:hypothetical protein
LHIVIVGAQGTRTVWWDVRQATECLNLLQGVVHWTRRQMTNVQDCHETDALIDKYDRFTGS